MQRLEIPKEYLLQSFGRVPSNWQKKYEEFSRKVKQAFDGPKQRYGAVKICRSLKDNGTPCSLKRVQRHMAALGLRSVVVKKYNHHANHGTFPDDKKNILDRNFEAETIHPKWCTDITYIHVLKEGWTYLASVMDLCSRKITGYAYGTAMTAGLAAEAVRNACLNGKDTRGIILHSDLGSQYTSQVFENYLSVNGIIHSFSRKGNPYDNACIESFHSVLKKRGDLSAYLPRLKRSPESNL